LKDEDYPVATWLSDRLISLPLFPQMTENEVELVVKGVKKVLDYARK
jgi:dTDP-4-amino-4,6-dideoxygalactose transaminase